MEDFDKAVKLILNKANPHRSISVPLSESLNKVIAKDVLADSDMPPFSRSAMDGYAIRNSDIVRPLKIIDRIAAGDTPEKTIIENTCAKIMTGAPVPDGADSVVRIEDTTLNDRGDVLISVTETPHNIRFKGEDVKKSDVIIKRNTLIKSHHIGLMASVGEINPEVFVTPVIDVLSTGSELVEPNENPIDAEIRNSNGIQLLAQLQSLGLSGNYLGISKDDPDYIREKIDQSLNSCDVLLVTGGVSMGDYDFVPDVLLDLGFDITLHKMKVRPGKPLLFATRNNQFVFGLPGNPVSALVQMEVVVKPFIYELMGANDHIVVSRMVMGEDFNRKKAHLKLFVPIKIVNGKVFLIEYHGSGHLASYVEADGIMEVDEGIDSIKKDETVNVRSL